MSNNANDNIIIKKSETSKIDSVDFENLSFGNVFTDHMLICDYKQGIWEKPVIQPYEPFLIDPSAKVFHYGQAIFEGMKAYKDGNDDVWLFRPDQNYERFNKSAKRLAMPEVPEAVFMEGMKKLIELDKQWVKNEVGSSLYIRPFMIATGPGVVAAPAQFYRFMIILSPAKAYYSGEVKVIVAEHYSRAANGGIGAAKAAGNYSAQFYPTKLANEMGYQQIIWTDDATHTRLEEAGTMNVFFRINDTLYTAPTSERILDGVTRKSLIAIAERENIKVDVRPILVEELIAAAENGTLQEIFGSGTAAVVNPIVGFSYKEKYYELPKQENSLALQLKAMLNNIQYKLAEDTFGWTVKI
ncbi:branched-chain amino acid aminotransferase [Flavobacterium litorale]|uniref:Branched-chain-amino-acid aminotransferase n=1 Tax=Flavobacterium litorale TaxID=2856519 RepID=A0ABX8VAB3_9FLAO|nr:branched-chain amino acid aminotransferase [Flavobacterium litorale]QYJ68128.1 branched-chain amino acid aminotransferase [Flavobacterium litorale]